MHSIALQLNKGESAPGLVSNESIKMIDQEKNVALSTTKQSLASLPKSSPRVKLSPKSISVPEIKCIEERTPIIMKKRKSKSSSQSQSESPILDTAHPFNLLVTYLRENGYEAETRSSSKVEDYFLQISEKHIEAYDNEVVKAVREQDVSILREFLKDGKQLQCCNRFGESLIHMACRRGQTEVVRFLIKEANVTLRVKDDLGRTPMHDACWTVVPNFELMELILHHEPDLMLIKDVRGHSPFSYARQDHWKDWRDFLTHHKNSLRLNIFG
mmetsp:Transcript_14832/g.18092  ORF Transcript_14832/g.18092 Transcript_14832/m.18092 type:complete len:271 (-) Transcript_14832:127-939(-)